MNSNEIEVHSFSVYNSKEGILPTAFQVKLVATDSETIKSIRNNGGLLVMVYADQVAFITENKDMLTMLFVGMSQMKLFMEDGWAKCHARMLAEQDKRQINPQLQQILL